MDRLPLTTIRKPFIAAEIICLLYLSFIMINQEYETKGYKMPNIWYIYRDNFNITLIVSITLLPFFLIFVNVVLLIGQKKPNYWLSILTILVCLAAIVSIFSKIE